MRTNTRVEFGLYDVTARGDSLPASTSAQAFCNLKRDLLLDTVPRQNKFGTLESKQWLMDGSFSFFPETPTQSGVQNSPIRTVTLPRRRY